VGYSGKISCGIFCQNIFRDMFAKYHSWSFDKIPVMIFWQNVCKIFWQNNYISFFRHFGCWKTRMVVWPKPSPFFCVVVGSKAFVCAWFRRSNAATKKKPQVPGVASLVSAAEAKTSCPGAQVRASPRRPNTTSCLRHVVEGGPVVGELCAGAPGHRGVVVYACARRLPAPVKERR
jgi:hypothetical protein